MNSVIISANPKISFFNYLRRIWAYRFFSYSLGIADLKNKYAKTYSGIALSIIQSLLGLFVYWLIFSQVIGINTNTIPYPVFVYIGIIMWQFFSTSVFSTSWALINSERLIAKMAFPRINIVFAKLVISSYDFLIGLLVFILLLIIYPPSLSYTVAFVPLILILLIISSLAVGLWLSILSMYFRDIGYIIMQLVNFSVFITPVFYPESIIPDEFKFFLYINPVAGVIEYIRVAIFNVGDFNYYYFFGFAFAIVLFISAIWVYKRIEGKIADLL